MDNEQDLINAMAQQKMMNPDQSVTGLSTFFKRLNIFFHPSIENDPTEMDMELSGQQLQECQIAGKTPSLSAPYAHRFNK